MNESNFSRLCTPAELRRVIDGRPLYFWGARHGYGMCRVFERLGIKPEGFIDSSTALIGQRVLEYPVKLPAEILGGGLNPFVVITSSFFADVISRQCRAFGLVEERDFIPFSRIQRFDYQIDISGSCNLRCISCPRGNMPYQPPAGFMKAPLYEMVLDKILREDPFTGMVTLYNWGEPLLNPDLARIVRATNERGIPSAISSNLNIRKDFSDVVEAGPQWFRISLSGFETSYEITHTGGNWELLLENMEKLKRLRERYHPGMVVEVFYHIYRHNNREDFRNARALCERLGFTFRYRHAALAPLDNVASAIEGREVSAEARATMDLQILPIREAMSIARKQRDRACSYERCLCINWDLSIAQCMEWYADNRTLTQNDFLSTSLEEIVEARKTSDFCRRCKERAIHQCYVVYGDESLIARRRSVEDIPEREPCEQGSTRYIP